MNLQEVKCFARKDLGLKLNDLFESFDPNPIAAASIAQASARLEVQLASGTIWKKNVSRCDHVRFGRCRRF